MGKSTNDKPTRTPRKDMPDIATLTDVSAAAANMVIRWLEEAADIKARIGEAPDTKKGKEGYGLLKRLDELTANLLQAQLATDQDGLRHGDLVFVASMRPGRSILDQTKLAQELVLAGVDIKTVKDCIERATKSGDDYWVREIVRLKG